MALNLVPRAFLRIGGGGQLGGEKPWKRSWVAVTWKTTQGLRREKYIEFCQNVGLGYQDRQHICLQVTVQFVLNFNPVKDLAMSVGWGTGGINRDTIYTLHSHFIAHYSSIYQ